MHAFGASGAPQGAQTAPRIAVTFATGRGSEAFEPHGETTDVVFVSEDRRRRFRTLERFATRLRASASSVPGSV
jgi:hypothetical protein